MNTKIEETITVLKQLDKEVEKNGLYEQVLEEVRGLLYQLKSTDTHCHKINKAIKIIDGVLYND